MSSSSDVFENKMHTCDAIDRNDQLRPQACAIRQVTSSLSWHALAVRVRRLARHLANLGCDGGARVAILGANSSAYIEMSYAAQWLGAVAVPLNVRWTPEEVAFALLDSQAAFLAVGPEHRSLVSKIHSKTLNGRTLISLDDSTAQDASYVARESLAEIDVDWAPPNVRHELASLFYTGGTTGRPKGVMLTHENHVRHSEALLETLSFDSSMVYLHAAPMFHIADSLFLHLVTSVGGTHAVLPKFDISGLAETIERYGITDTILVPTMIQMVSGDRPIADRVFGKLKRLFYGASPMPVALLRTITERYPKLELVQLYGQTESSPVLTVLSPCDHQLDSRAVHRTSSAGKAIARTQVKVMNPAGDICRSGEVGEIVARGPQIMKGYWQRPEETASALRDGWLHTGDVGYADVDGYIFVTDRLKDMIITGGENVYSVEVEQVLYQLDGVDQCCVIGVPHERWGEAVHAVVVPKAGHSLSEETIFAHCAALLADFKRPRSVTIRAQPLPTSGAGKILKRELRDELRQPPEDRSATKLQSDNDGPATTTTRSKALQ